MQEDQCLQLLHQHKLKVRSVLDCVISCMKQLKMANSLLSYISPLCSNEPKCPFKNCVPWRCIVLDGRNHSNFTLETIQSLSLLLSTAWHSQYINTTGKHSMPVYVVRMPAEEDGEGP